MAEIRPRCPECGYAMRVRRGKRGEFLSCLRYPDCKGTLELDAVPLVAEALSVQAIRMSPRTLSAVLIAAALCTRDEFDGDDAIEEALAISGKLMQRLKDEHNALKAQRDGNSQEAGGEVAQSGGAEAVAGQNGRH